MVLTSEQRRQVAAKLQRLQFRLACSREDLASRMGLHYRTLLRAQNREGGVSHKFLRKLRAFEDQLKQEKKGIPK